MNPAPAPGGNTPGGRVKYVAPGSAPPGAAAGQAGVTPGTPRRATLQVVPLPRPVHPPQGQSPEAVGRASINYADRPEKDGGWREPRPGLTLTPPWITVIVLGVIVLALYARLFLAPTAVAQETQQQTAHTIAGIRLAVLLTSERIDEFQLRYHRTPSDLGELGMPGPPMIGYERLSDSRYRLTAPSSSGPLVFDSMHSKDGFIARSLDILREPVAATP